MSVCWACGDAPATTRMQRRLGDVGVGRPVGVCDDCADELEAGR